jgi:hypothetical protein
MAICIADDCSTKPTPGTTNSAEPRCRAHQKVHNRRLERDRKRASAGPSGQSVQDARTASSLARPSIDTSPDVSAPQRPAQPLLDASAAIAAWAIANATPSTAPGRIPAVEPEPPARWSPWD